jgi:predicted nucleotidyltransferase
MYLKDKIQERIQEFIALCKAHKVKSLYAFGSAVSDRFNEAQSDIDLIIEIDSNDPIERGEFLMSIWDQLELFFQRKVDLLTDNSLKNPFLRKSIEASKTKLYDGEKQQISL